jgi:hypothetical protein
MKDFPFAFLIFVFVFLTSSCKKDDQITPTSLPIPTPPVSIQGKWNLADFSFTILKIFNDSIVYVENGKGKNFKDCITEYKTGGTFLNSGSYDLESEFITPTGDTSQTITSNVNFTSTGTWVLKDYKLVSDYLGVTRNINIERMTSDELILSVTLCSTPTPNEERIVGFHKLKYKR